MSDVHVEGGTTPVKIEHSGCGYGLAMFVIATSAAFGALSLMLMTDNMAESNRLTEKQLEVQQQQLKLEQQRYTLDSLKYFNNIKQR